MTRHPFFQLFFARLREFTREPGVMFWVFGFPILLAVGLGLAFRNRPQDVIVVGVMDGARAEATLHALGKEQGFDAQRVTADEATQRLRLGKISIVVVPGEANEYRYDPTRPDSVLARQRVDDALQRAAGRKDAVVAADTLVTEPGARYIDFLIPGLLGMNIMSGGMWGVGYAIVDMRSRKLLKRLIATPMKRTHFLAAMLASRVVFVLVEMLILLTFGRVVFGLVLRGAIWQVAALSLLGAFVFSALGIFVASRTQKVETVSGLMNLVMLPMFVFSGVFFSAERFPPLLLPYVQALPLTALNDALRAVVLEGADLSSQLGRIAVLCVWGGVSVVLALRLFKWT